MIPIFLVRSIKSIGSTIAGAELSGVVSRSPMLKPWLVSLYRADTGVTLAGSAAVDGGRFDTWEDQSPNGYDAVQPISSRNGYFTAADARGYGVPSVGSDTKDGIIGVTTPEITTGRCYMIVGYKTGVETEFEGYPRFLHTVSDTVKLSGDTGQDYAQVSGAVDATPAINGKAGAPTMLPMPLSLVRVDYEQLTEQWNLGWGGSSGRVNGPVFGFLFTTGEEAFNELQETELWFAEQAHASIVAAYTPASTYVTGNSGTSSGGTSGSSETTENSAVYDGAGGDNAALTTVAIIAQQAEAAGQPITFGMPFKQGDFPSGSTITAKIGGVDLPIQIDRKAEYSTDASTEFTRRDTALIGTRSVLNAIISTNIPAAQVLDDVTIIDLYVTAGSDRTIGTPLAFPSRTVEVEVIEGATTYTADLSGLSLDASQSVFGSGDTSDWLSGPDCREWQIRLPLKNGGTEHARLLAVLGIRHYATGQTRFDVAVENTKYGTIGNSVEYDVRIKVDSVLRYTRDDLQHYQFSRWRIVVWDTPREMPHVDFDPAYLMATKMTPNYYPNLIRSLAQPQNRSKSDNYWSDIKPIETNVLYEDSGDRTYTFQNELQAREVAEGTVGAFPVTVSEAGPLGIGKMLRYMESTGGWEWIGPLPGWQSNWILDQQVAQYRLMLKYGDLGGSWPIHYRDTTTGNIADVADYPTANQPAENVKSTTNISPYKPDKAHQPSMAFVPYLVTGDAYYLEELQAWAAYNAFRMDAAHRGNDKGIFEASSQIRGWAWGLRNLAQAAIATPDNHPLKASYLYMVESNINDSILNYVTNPGVDYGAVLGNQLPIQSPWMDDYLTWTCGYLVDLGFASMAPFAQWKGNYAVKRLGIGGEWCFQMAGAYRVLISPTSSIPLSEDGGIALTTILKRRFNDPLTYYMFTDMEDCYDMSNRATNGGFNIPGDGNFTASHPCGSQELADELGLELGEMIGNSGFEAGWAAQLGAGIAAAVDSGTPGASTAHAAYLARVNVPDYSHGTRWAIVPRL